MMAATGPRADVVELARARMRRGTNADRLLEAVLEGQRAIHDEQRMLRGLVEQLLARTPATQLDVAERTLLCAIVASVGAGKVFTADEVLLKAQHEDSSLGSALASLRIRSPRSLGRRLKSLIGRGVTQVVKSNVGMLWTVETAAIDHCSSGILTAPAKTVRKRSTR